MNPEDKLPMPGVADEIYPIPSSTGEKSYRESGTRPFTIRHKDQDRDDSAPRQPNDRDESPDSQESEPREVIRQAYDDIMQGQVDTDLHGQRGVEETVSRPLKPASEMPQKHGQT